MGRTRDTEQRGATPLYPRVIRGARQGDKEGVGITARQIPLPGRRTNDDGLLRQDVRGRNRSEPFERGLDRSLRRWSSSRLAVACSVDLLGARPEARPRARQSRRSGTSHLSFAGHSQRRRFSGPCRRLFCMILVPSIKYRHLPCCALTRSAVPQTHGRFWMV